MSKKPTKAELLKPSPTWMLVEIGGQHIVIPHAAGVALVNTLEHAEKYTKRYGHPSLISPITTDDYSHPKFTLISQEHYLEAKMNHVLLGANEPPEDG